MTASTIRLRRWLAGLALLLALPATSAVAQDFELPPVDEVFVLSAQATAPDRIEVRWRIADGYVRAGHRAGPHRGALADRRRLTNSSATSKPTARNCSAPSPARPRPARARPP
uniref:Cytochrome c-type biogenesis protein DsbD, protein-disulfide reductase n=1 Tax=Klebsiella pneumoniae TaxID=573 RepID=A0A7L9EWN4_KLEPN|nr:Cytochrome c-type biogenesis protein DsbD, protein-disulfide reductase [Klebsiella pneumoniae]